MQTVQEVRRSTEQSVAPEGRTIKVLLLGASFSTNNMGVGALTAGTIRSLLSAFPHAEIALLDYGKESTVHHLDVDGRSIPVRLVNLRFSKKFYLRNNVAYLLALGLLAKLIPSRMLRGRLLAGNPWLSEVTGADLCAAISGGDSFSDIYGLGRLLYVSLPQILVLLVGRKLVLLPQTIGPFRGRFARAIARHIMNRATRVYSRDRRGVADIGLLAPRAAAEGRVRFCYDVGFVLQPAQAPKTVCKGIAPESPRERPLVGLNVSGLLYMGGYTRQNMFGLRTDYPTLVDRVIQLLLHRLGADVLLVPHVFGEGPRSESDVPACEEMFQKWRMESPGRIGIVRGRMNPHEVKHTIGQCDFFVASRMHACIAAVSQTIPAVAIAYSDKFAGVMETLGIESVVADPRKSTADEIVEQIAAAFRNREKTQQILADRMPEVRSTVLSLFREFAGQHGSQGRA